MAFGTQKEKRAFRLGFLKGQRSCTYKPKKANNGSLKTYSFQAFNSNCDIFNVDAKGRTRSDALKTARRFLKTDPGNKHWEVTITDAKGDKENFFRTVSVSNNGNVHDNWKPYYKK